MVLARDFIFYLLKLDMHRGKAFCSATLPLAPVSRVGQSASLKRLFRRDAIPFVGDFCVLK
jgi:hypothetical protein